MAKKSPKSAGKLARKASVATAAPKSAASLRTSRVAKHQTAPPTTSYPPSRQSTKSAAVLAALQRPEGTTLAALMKATGWQAHSVRGFLSGTVRRRLGLTLLSDTDGEIRRYRVAPATN